MRIAQLTVIKDGINRLRPKGGARADSLYDLVNAYVTAERTVVGRPGTRRGTVDVAGTVGLVAFEDELHVFSSSYVDIATVFGTVTVAADGGVSFGWLPGVGGDFQGTAAAEAVIETGLFVNLSATPDRLQFNGFTGGGDSTNVGTFLQAAPTLRVQHAGGYLDIDTADYAIFDPNAGGFTATDYPEISTLWTAADVGQEYTLALVAPGAGAIADGYVLDILLHPTDPDAELVRIHYATPFLGALYVVAEFDDGGIFHYWLQTGTTWAADTEYSANQFVQPTTANGYVYRAIRYGDPYQAWAPGVPRTAGNGSSISPSIIEPTTYNEYYYTVVVAEGDNPRSAQVEPVWPTATGERITENADDETAAENISVNPPTPPEPNTPQSSTTDRYTL